MFLRHVTLHMGGPRSPCVCMFTIWLAVWQGGRLNTSTPLGWQKYDGGWDVKKRLINISSELSR